MKLINRVLVLFATMVSLVGCIGNDIPYPVEEIAILAYEGNGFSAHIDPVTRTVTLTLDEQTNMSAVEVTNVQITEHGVSSINLTGTFNLTSPLKVTLSRYQDYEWTIRATQTIERYFTVMGQIGSSEIDVNSRTATAYVAEGTDLSNIVITSLKLGPKEVTTMEPAPESIVDFSTVRYIYLQYPALSGQTQRWQLYVKPTDVKVQITKSDVWATCAWLSGAAEEGTTVGFRYRLTGDEQWVDATQVETAAGVFTCKVTGLEPLTSYDFVAYSNDDLSPIITKSTEGTIDLVNGGFEQWSVIKDIIYPYAEGVDPYWATGNVGASIANAVLTEGVADIRPGSSGKTAARLASKYANVLGVGKFAAGNLFIGSYVRNDGTHGIVHFGRRFTARPTALKGWFKYNCGIVDHVSAQPPGETVSEGDSDTGMIYIALGDWSAADYGGTEDSPVEIVTRRIDETAFDINSDAVIAYGEMPLKQSVNDWTEFTIPLEYRATDRVPTHIIIVCSASRYGDYFTGSSKSVMWLDDFELIYE